jgi:natural product biosynthesis luciferase-like monooxygenase protein
MKFGLYYLPSFDPAVHRNSETLYQQIFEQVELGEALGLESVWVAEHHFSSYGGDIPSPPLFLAALAQRTKRMRIGTGGVALPLSKPLNTAEQLAMVDAMSGGRLEIGVVRAFLNFEYDALNIDMGESRDRFNESIEILRGTWENERFSYHGKFNHFDNVELRPRPVQPSPPITVGSVMSPESIIAAGHQGFDLMVIPYAVSPEGVREQVSLHRHSLEEAGHDPAKQRVMAPYHLYVHEDVEVAKATAREPILRYVSYLRDSVSADKWSGDYESYRGMVKKVESLMDFDLIYDGRALIGDPAHVHECIELAADIGVTEISLVTILPGLSQDKVLDSMRCFASNVMPKYA